MPRNAATNSNTEAERLPILINRKRTKTRTKSTQTTTTFINNTLQTTNLSQQFRKQQNINKHKHRKYRQEEEEEDKIIIVTDNIRTPPNRIQQIRRSVSPNSSFKSSKTSNINIEKEDKEEEELSGFDESNKPWNTFLYNVKKSSDDIDCDNIQSKSSKTQSNTSLYPGVIDLTGNTLDIVQQPSRVTTRSSSTSTVPLPSSLWAKEASSIVKRKKKQQTSNRRSPIHSTRDHIRLASLRVRKTSTPAGGEGESNNKKNKPPFVNKQSVSQTPLPPHLHSTELNRIDVLEFDESKCSFAGAGGGGGGGTKRKRNNSLTAPFTVTTRKRAAAVKCIPLLHTVEPKGGNARFGGCNTANNMSLYGVERRYQAATAAADEGGRVVVGSSNGYLNATRNAPSSSSAISGVLHTTTTTASSSAAGDNGLTDVPMETQYYLTTGGNSIATSSLASGGGGMPLSNGGGGGGISGGSGATASISTINHAPSMATLCNIGNSCYLNSVVYTLRFAPRFLHNLHHLIVDLATVQQNIVRHRAAKSASLGRGIGINASQLENSARSWSSKDLASLDQFNSGNTAIQSSNGASGTSVAACGGDICKSRHQLLTEKLHELFQSLHRNEIAESTEPHHADKLLHAIQDVNAIFEGNQQQDAHEFLMCVLNSIRETCQTLIKLIADCPELISEGNIKQTDETDGSDRDLTAAGFLMNANVSSTLQQSSTAPLTAQSQSSLSTSNFTKTSFFSRKSKRKDESKSTKNFRLQSPLKDAAANSYQQPHQQTVANSHFYLNSVDLNSASTAAATQLSSPTSATAPNSISKLTSSASSDISDAAAAAAAAAASSNPMAKQRLAEKIRELGLDFFSEDFEGITVATTKCLSCETVTEQKESMIDIAVPVPISGYDSSDYTEKPNSFIQNSCITREYFRGENKYRCEQCTGYTEAIRSISYEVLPRLLVIQLSRFSGGMEKINSYIPTSFTLQCFCSKCCELSDANKLHIYKLYSVITHVGATMSVGHYIAYTCSLDWANEYVNCPKDRRPQQAQQQPNGFNVRENNNTTTTTTTTSTATSAALALASSGTSLMKKMKFGRSKASSSGDISKNFKNLNGLTNSAAVAAAAAAAAAANSQSITNGISKLSMNATCHSLNCCATRLSTVQHQQYQQQQQQHYSLSDLNEESSAAAAAQNGAANHHNAIVTSSSSSGGSYASFSSGYGSTGRGGTKATPFAASCNGAEPIWYMCDDDKIKAMTQREFEELLSPSRKITITPYLLFYARFDLQQATTAATAATATTTTTKSSSAPASACSAQQTTTMPQSKTAMSWSNENLQCEKM